jgi:hypothetical protein
MLCGIHEREEKCTEDYWVEKLKEGDWKTRHRWEDK